jgi:hypothetical protein
MVLRPARTQHGSLPACLLSVCFAHDVPLNRNRSPEGRQVKRLKDLEKENERLRKAVSDLTLEKLILKGAALGKF